MSSVVSDTSLFMLWLTTSPPSTAASAAVAPLAALGILGLGCTTASSGLAPIHGSEVVVVVVVVGHSQSARSPLFHAHLSMRSQSLLSAFAAQFSTDCFVVPAQQPGSCVVLVVVISQSLASSVSSHSQSLRSQPTWSSSPTHLACAL